MRLRLEPNRSVDCDDTTTPDRAGVWADRGSLSTSSGVASSGLSLSRIRVPLDSGHRTAELERQHTATLNSDRTRAARGYRPDGTQQLYVFGADGMVG